MVVCSGENGSDLRMRRSTKRPRGDVRTMVEVGSVGAGGLEVPEVSQRMEWRIEMSAFCSEDMVEVGFSLVSL